jgi:hypothetical protein
MFYACKFYPSDQTDHTSRSEVRSACVLLGISQVDQTHRGDRSSISVMSTCDVFKHAYMFFRA